MASTKLSVRRTIFFLHFHWHLKMPRCYRKTYWTQPTKIKETCYPIRTTTDGLHSFRYASANMWNKTNKEPEVINVFEWSSSELKCAKFLSNNNAIVTYVQGSLMYCIWYAILFLFLSSVLFNLSTFYSFIYFFIYWFIYLLYYVFIYLFFFSEKLAMKLFL